MNRNLPPHYPAGNALSCALAFTLALAGIGLAIPGCTAAGQLTPAAAAVLEGTAAALCPLESMVPIIGTVAAAACPTEEAGLAAALTQAEGPVPSTTAALVPVYRVTAKGLRHVGSVVAAKAPAVQRALLLGPKPQPVVADSTATSSRPTTTSPPAPVALQVVDAGALVDGGR